MFFAAPLCCQNFVLNCSYPDSIRGNSNNFNHTGDFPGAQDQSSLSYYPNSTSINSYNQEYSFLDNLTFELAPYATSAGPSQTTSCYESIVIEEFPQAHLDAENQHFTAQGAGQSHILQPQQAPDIFLPTSEMSDITPEHSYHAQVGESTLLDENTPLKCTFPTCPEQQLFSTRSALKRHQDKHIRPYICHHASCYRKSFSDKGGLERHKREVHGSQAYICPVLSCKRNKKGFHRRYNLFEHQKRAHSLQPSRFLRRGSTTSREPSEGRESTVGPQCEDTFESLDGGEIGSIVEICGDVNLNREQHFRKKLQDLRIMRAEIDEDIRSMERALRIMDDSSP